MNRVIGFLAGVGAGAGLGLLLAPRSGERTRSLLRRKAGHGADHLRRWSSGVRDAAAEAHVNARSNSAALAIQSHFAQALCG